MIDKWKKQYPRVVKLLMNPAILTFYNFLRQSEELFIQLI